MIIKKVNRIPTHCGVAYESVHSLAIGHVIRVWYKWFLSSLFGESIDENIDTLLSTSLLLPSIGELASLSITIEYITTIKLMKIIL